MGRKKLAQQITAYHGGVPGLAIGDYILPRDRLPAWAGAVVNYAMNYSQTSLVSAAHRWMHFTTDFNYARACASEYVDPPSPTTGTAVARPGTVYKIRTQGKVTSDPDFAMFPNSFGRAKLARIIDIVDTNVTMTERARAAARGPYQYFAIGQPVYDKQGYLQPSAAMAAAGKTARTLRPLGAWVPLLWVTKSGEPNSEWRP